MNFALMFALALGIDYALFVVYRFRGALFGSGAARPRDAVAVTMDTAGKAVLFSGVTVLISLSAVMLVPSPAFRSMALGIMLSVVFVLAATLTLLPAVLAKLGPRVDKLALPWVHSGEHRSPRFARWGERLWRRPLLFGWRAARLVAARRAPACWARHRDALDQGRARGTTPRVRATSRSRPPSATARPARSRSSPAPTPAAAGPPSSPRPRHRAACSGPAAAGGGGRAARPGGPDATPPTRRSGATIDRLRATLPPARSSAAPPPRTTTSSRRSPAKTPLVIGVVLALGFLLLLSRCRRR